MPELTVAFGVIAVIALFAAVYFWLNPRQPKLRLAYQVTEDRPLFAADTLESLRLFSFDIEVKEPWITGLAIVNTGKGPIRKSDFEGSVNFVFTGDVAFLQSQAVGNSALGYAGTGGPDGTELVLGFEPQLLNRGERAEMIVLTDGRPELVRVEGRVAGLASIAPMERSTAMLTADDETLRRLDRVERIQTAISFLAGAVLVAAAAFAVIDSLMD